MFLATPAGRRVSCLASAFVMTALAAVASLAQDSTAPLQPATGDAAKDGRSVPSERFGETIQVRIVNLEVQVRDPLGRVVTGLPREAFTVRIGTEEVPLAHFDEVKLIDHRTAAEGSVPLGSEDPANRPTSNYLFFLDNELALKTRRNMALKFLRRELGRLEPGDQASIVAFDGEKLEILSEWSASTEQVDRVLEKAMSMPAGGIHHLARRRLVNFVANWEGNAARRSVLAASAALRALPAPPGRKVLMLLAGGWNPAELTRAGDFASWCVSGNCDGLRVVRVLTDTANFLDYSIVAVDVEGRDVDLNWHREKNIHDLLTYLAHETGGRVLLNSEGRKALERASESGRSYYSLAVYPPADLDQLRMGISVEVDGDELRAFTQRSFVNVSRERDEELDALNRLLFRSKQGDFPLTIGIPKAEPAGRALVPFTVGIPLQRLDWVPDTDGWRGRYEIHVATQDNRGNASEVQKFEYEPRLAKRPDATDFEFVDLEIRVKRRKQTLSVLVKDRLSDRTLSVVVPFEPRPKKKRGARQAALTSGT